MNPVERPKTWPDDFVLDGNDGNDGAVGFQSNHRHNQKYSSSGCNAETRLYHGGRSSMSTVWCLQRICLEMEPSLEQVLPHLPPSRRLGNYFPPFFFCFCFCFFFFVCVSLLSLQVKLTFALDFYLYQPIFLWKPDDVVLVALFLLSIVLCIGVDWRNQMIQFSFKKMSFRWKDSGDMKKKRMKRKKKKKKRAIWMLNKPVKLARRVNGK